MDHHLHENAKKWLKRAKRYHAADAANRDPYTAYFSYFIALLILAKEHDNNLPPSKKADSEEKMFRNLFRDFFEEILSALDTPSLRPVTHELAGRLSQIHPGSDQAIIFISPFEQASLGEERRNKIKESRDRAIKDMKALASYWAGKEYEAKPEDLSKFVFTFFGRFETICSTARRAMERQVELAKTQNSSTRLVACLTPLWSICSPRTSRTTYLPPRESHTDSGSFLGLLMIMLMLRNDQSLTLYRRRTQLARTASPPAA